MQRQSRSLALVLGLLAATSAAAAFTACSGDDSTTPAQDAGADGTSPHDGALPPDGAPDSPSPRDAGADATDAPPPPVDAADAATSDAADAATTDATATDSGDAAPADAAPADAATTDAATTDATTDAADADVDAADAAPECDPDAGLGCDSGACCSGRCVDTSKDPTNCGTCGNACTTSQFCTGTACTALAITNVCANANGSVVTDGISEDDTAGGAIGAAIASSCTPAVVVRTIGQDAGGVVDPSTGRPITGVGDTFIAGGGGFAQLGVRYMDQALTPIYASWDNTAQTASFLTRASNAVVLTAPFSALTATHDYFVVELAVEPTSGTLCLIAYGMLGPGTTAAGFYAGTVMMPNHATYTDRWYVYEWTDSTGDGGTAGPSADDTFTLVQSGM